MTMDAGEPSRTSRDDADPDLYTLIPQLWARLDPGEVIEIAREDQDRALHPGGHVPPRR